MHVQGTELLTTFSGAIDEATRIYQLDVNPQDVGVELPIESFPYDECEWNLFEALAVPATNLQGSGQVILAYANDPSNPLPPEDEEGNRLMSSWKHDSFAIWEKGQCKMPLKDGRRKFYIHEAAPGEVDDQRMTVAGRLFAQAMTDLTPADGGAACVLYARYDVVLIDASLDEDFSAGTLLASGKIGPFSASPFGASVEPFAHVYETAEDAVGDADATLFRGDLSFARKVSDSRLVLKQGMYFVTFTFGGTTTSGSLGSAASEVCLWSRPEGWTAGADGYWLMEGYSGFSGTLLGVGFCGGAAGLPQTEASFPFDMTGGCFYQLASGGGAYQYSGATPWRQGSIVTAGFTVQEDGTSVDFDMFVRQLGIDMTLRSADMVLTRITSRVSPTGYVQSKGSWSRSLLRLHEEMNRPWRATALDAALKRKLSKVNVDDLATDDLLVYNILMDKKTSRAPAFVGALGPILLEMLKHAGIAVGGAVLKHAVGKFEAYCEKHEKHKRHEMITSTSTSALK